MCVRTPILTLSLLNEMVYIYHHVCSKTSYQYACLASMVAMLIKRVQALKLPLYLNRVEKSAHCIFGFRYSVYDLRLFNYFQKVISAKHKEIEV